VRNENVIRIRIVPFMLTSNVGAVSEYCYMIQSTVRVMSVEYVFVWIEFDSAVGVVVFSIYYV
jgi:hypothetical protein